MKAKIQGADWKILKKKLEDRYNNKISQEELLKYFNENIIIQPYIGIVTKYIIVQGFESSFSNQIKDFLRDTSKTDVTILHLTYDLNILFGILFRYTNINISIDDYRTANYDLVYKTGLYKYIYTVVEEDFNNLKNICDKVVGINYLNLTLNMETLFGKPINVEDAAKFREEIEKISPERLDALLKIQQMNDPAMASLVKEMNKNSIKQIINEK